jgi:apolipoprotein N-acyltransferase
VALTLATGVLYGLSFPPARLHLLAWIALVPFFVAIRRVGLAAALGLGWLWSVLAAWSVGQWMPGAIETYYLQPRWVGFAFFLLVATVMVAPYHMAFAAAYHRFGKRPTVWTPLLVAAAWAAAELGRGRLFTGTPLFIGNPWALLGYSQAGLLPLVQVADLAGIYGVSFVVAATNAALAETWLALRGLGLPAAKVARTLVLSLLPLALALAYGSVRLMGFGGPRPIAPAVEVGVVQGNIAVGSTWRPEHYGENLDRYLRLTLSLLRGTRPQLVIWPETAMTFFLENEAGFRSSIAAVLSPFGTELVAGGPRASASAGPPFFNSVYVLSPEGELGARYDKEYLVPFGEYFPLRSVEFLRRRFGRVREFEAGPAHGPLPTRAGAAGVLICNEAMLPEVAGRRVAAGATYLLNPSNDSWVPSEKFAEIEFDIVSMRAIEQRRYFVRASTSGPSAIVDPYGRILVRSRPFSVATLPGEIAPIEGRSFYGRAGDLFGVACAAIAAAALGRKRRRAADSFFQS